MKTKKSQKPRPAQAIELPKLRVREHLSNFREPVYCREEIAPIAAQLLEGYDYARAVKRATELLEECDRQRLSNEKINLHIEAEELALAEKQRVKSLPTKERNNIPADEKFRLDLPVTFLEMVRFATGVKSAHIDRARDNFLDLIGIREAIELTSWGKAFDSCLHDPFEWKGLEGMTIGPHGQVFFPPEDTTKLIGKLKAFLRLKKEKIEKTLG